VLKGRTRAGNVFLEGLPIVNEPVTLKILVVPHNADEWGDQWEKKLFVQMSEKEAGIKTQWTKTDAQGVTAVLASGDLPDLFMHSAVSETTIAQNSDLFYAFTDNDFKKYMPHILDYYEKKMPDWKSFLTYPDGKIYGPMGGWYYSPPHLTDAFFWINTTWLKNLNLAMPVTIDDFHNVLKAFKEKDADGDGNSNNEVPLEFANKNWASGIQYYAGWFGIYGYFNVKNGKILPSVNTPEYRQYLEYFHNLIEEGLINKEGFSETSEQFYSNIDQENRGIFAGWSPSSFIRKNPQNGWKWEAMPFPRVPGITPVAYGGSKKAIQANRTSFILSRSSKNKEAAMRWWDWLGSSDDMKMITVNGAEGDYWYRNTKGEIVFGDSASAEIKTKYGITTGAISATLGLIDGQPVLYDVPYTDRDKFSTSPGLIRTLAIDTMLPYISDEPSPRFLLIPERANELSLLEVDLIPFIDQFRDDAILNGLTDSKWNAYVKELDTYRYKDYLEFKQKYYDNKL
jgi:putative aldouronate transport system substrate-binding protein